MHIRAQYGGGIFGQLTSRHVKRIRNEVAQAFTDLIGDVALGLISVPWEYANKRLDLDANPTVGVARLHEPKREWEPWPDEVIEAFDKVARPMIRLARLLAFYTGQRRSDVVQMRRDQFDGEVIHGIKQIKTNALLTIPCHKVLREALEAVPAKTGFILTTNKRGNPYTASGLALAFRRTLVSVGGSGYSIHGLRKNASVALAEAGCADREIMAITGHKSVSMVTRYTKRADQLRRAKSAMKKWEDADDGRVKKSSSGKQ